MKENRGSLLRLWRVFIAIVLVSAVDPFLASSAKASDIVVEQCNEAGLTGALTTVQGSGGGTITFSCGPDPVTITITVMKNIITDVAINGGGLISLSGGDSTRLFKVNSGASLALQNITLRDGFSSGADGGAIWNEGILTVENSKFLENSSDLAKSGGAIVSYGPLTIIDSEFSDNQAYNGGAVYPRWSAAVTNISGSTFLRNQALGGEGKGGALMAWDGPPVTVSDSVFEENHAVQEGGGIYIMANSSLDLVNSSLVYNDTTYNGGGGALYIAGTASITHTNILSNTSGGGGGLLNEGTTTINKSLIGFNNVGTSATSIYFGGGGIYNGGSAVLNLMSSSVVSNDAIESGGGMKAYGTAAVLNSTFFGNEASGWTASGGAIYADGIVSLNFSTFLDNRVSGSAEYGETLFAYSGASLSLKNSIVQSVSPACYGTVASLGYNIASDISCVWGDQPGDHPNTDPQLGMWQDAEGTVWYTMPMPGSPAIDGGQSECEVTTDQRGYPRPYGAACDIGSLEHGPLEAAVAGACGEAEFDAALSLVQAGGGGTVTFDCEPDPFTIVFTGQKPITSNITMNGGGLISLSGGNSTRLFTVNSSAELVLLNITLRDGFGSGKDGGAVYNLGILTVDNSKFLENSTDLAYCGGAIYSMGPVSITDSEFANNESGAGGAVCMRSAAAAIGILGGSFHDNKALSTSSGDGGALLALDGAAVQVFDAAFYDNEAKKSGGGLYAASELFLIDTNVAENLAWEFGGGAYLEGNATIMQSQITGNIAYASGGGLNIQGSAMITDTLIYMNEGNGGGIHNYGSLGLFNSNLISNNRGSFQIMGGGLYNDVEAVAQIGASTFYDNWSFGGAGIANAGEIHIKNSSFINNRCTDEGGAAITNWGSLEVNFATFQENSCIGNSLGSKETLKNTGNLVLKNSIVHSWTAACYGPITSNGYNIASDSSCNLIAHGDRQNVADPGLALWQDADGLIWYTMPLAGGQAYDNGICDGTAFDQRGVTRPQDEGCDVGAIECAPGDPKAYIYLPVMRR